MDGEPVTEPLGLVVLDVWFDRELARYPLTAMPISSHCLASAMPLFDSRRFSVAGYFMPFLIQDVRTSFVLFHAIIANLCGGHQLKGSD